MSIRYDENTKVRAVRLVREHRDDYDSEWAAIKAISGRLGMNPQTLREWVRQAEVDAGEAAGMSTEEKRALRELRRKCRELESTIEILKSASFFARECAHPSHGRIGCLFTPRPRGAQPTGPIPPAVARPLFQGPGPIAPVHIPSPEAVYYEASSRVYSRSPARPSPRPGHPWMEQGQPWAHSPGSAPRRPGACSARRGGRRASSTRPELPHDRHRRTSYPAAHSLMCDLLSHDRAGHDPLPHT
jgi:transposase